MISGQAPGRFPGTKQRCAHTTGVLGYLTMKDGEATKRKLDKLVFLELVNIDLFFFFALAFLVKLDDVVLETFLAIGIRLVDLGCLG